MPGTITVNSSSVTIKSTAPTITTTAVSGVRQSKQIAGQYWEIDAELSQLTRQDFARIMGFISKQRNSLFSFDIIIPVLSDSSGGINTVRLNTSGNDTMAATSNVGVGSSQVAFDTAFSPSDFTQQGVDPDTALFAGDFIRFSNHNKVYQLTEDVVLNSTGGGTLNFFPNLIFPVSSGEEILYYDVPFRVYSKNETQEYGFGIGNANDITLQVKEAPGE